MMNPIQYLSFPQELFGMTYYSLLIPPFKPVNMLILGYGNGMIEKLTKMIWGGDIEVDGVDLVNPEVNGYNDFIQMSADTFVKKNCLRKYDYVVVDLYNGSKIPEFVFNDEFVLGLSKITRKILGINCTFHDWKNFEMYDKHFIVSAVKQINHDKVLLFDAKNYEKEKT